MHHADILNPPGEIHIPIGIPNALDTLKTFVEAEGSFSPGFGSYGIYFWNFDPLENRLVAPTMEDVSSNYGLHKEGYLIPWISWEFNKIKIKTEICEVTHQSPAGNVSVVAVYAHLTNLDIKSRDVSFYSVIRPLGPAGWSISSMNVSETGDALLVNGQPAMIAKTKPDACGVISSDEAGNLAVADEIPQDKSAFSENGDCSGAMRFDLTMERETTKTLEFIFPVLPGRYAARHIWSDFGQGALVDTAKLDSSETGVKQPAPGLSYYRAFKVKTLFSDAIDYWHKFSGRIDIKLPDPRWRQGMRAMLGHVGLSMNEGAPDVAVINYNVFNRDGIYVANMMQKSGLFHLAEQALDYFIYHPFNGRAYPEADNPGQILWSLGQQWLFTHNSDWLERIYPAVAKIAEMIKYYRTTPEPHWVNMESLEFGESLPADKRQELKPGRCDGYHPEYTQAFDIAGLRSAAILAAAFGQREKTWVWHKLGNLLFQSYNEIFGHDLGKGYGSYSVLWPCRLYPLETGNAYERFNKIGAMKSHSWRYFPLAAAHQGLLTGSREAGYGTVALHLNEKQMQRWYAFDEGGGSSSGGWHRVLTTWKHSIIEPGANKSVAMPHGWVTAELWLLMRDCLMFENDNDQIVLFGGIPEEWFTNPEGMEVKGLMTYFGQCDLEWIHQENGAFLKISGDASPPNGFILRLPDSLKAKATFNDEYLPVTSRGDYIMPKNAKEIRIQFI